MHHDSDGLGPDTLLWRFLGDRRFLLALPRAVSLQMLHPAIARGVRQHSRSPQHLWLHERHTVPQAIAIAYADRDLSSVVRFGHADVKGVLADGARYHALNPSVFYFQHATYVDTLFMMIERFVRPLWPGEREQLFAECALWYRRYGISDRGTPATWLEFEDYFHAECARVLRAGADTDFYRDQVLRPNHWVVRHVPTAAVHQMMHPRARELYGIRTRGSGTLTRYAAWRKAVAAVSPRDRYIPVARRALAARP
ncbi:oxygenase MpaB family protein [Rhodococcus sp. HNM0569]|uniref:oxygenase MpaB family protein n=1 Tax=Rhodococcus sp. HNM0569 TaxID=2716340 RepID=UPI00146A5E28|nr:oxygenase MpaB family protein [Rhodococcus sp. HNM0569]NLU81710.1 DUF2236 domain-containing protein [Rhodococcus sp. HNM0569]